MNTLKIGYAKEIITPKMGIPMKGYFFHRCAEALRMVKLENGPEYFDMPLTAFKLGDVALVTIPGEGFTNIGLELKKSDKHKLVIPLGLSNGYEGYFPMQDSYDEGGYEARSSYFKVGVAEHIIKEGKDLVKSL